MKIVVISTTVLTCPPKGYSGLEQLAYQQAEGLALRGHQVLLVAPVGSTPPTGVELHGTTLKEPEMKAYSGYWQRLGQFDCVIDNSWEKWSYILKREGALKAPILGIIHAPADTMYAVPPPVPKPCIVAISQDQANHAQQCWKVKVEVAYNGIDVGFYQPSLERGQRYLFLARISKIKGPQIALDVAKSCGVPLDIVGDDTLTGEPELAEAMRKSADGNYIIYHGGVDRTRTVEFFSKAKALFHMNQIFREPFGLAPVEAQACGCPVIAWDNGAMRETIKHGETGFLVKSVEEVEAHVRSNDVEKISPQVCRSNALRFSLDKMVERYEQLAKQAVETGGW